jgi:hypothetical protein
MTTTLSNLQSIELFRTQANRLCSYTVAYVDFFDEEIKQQDGDWKRVLKSYLFSGSKPLINGYAGGRKFNVLPVAQNLTIS